MNKTKWIIFAVIVLAIFGGIVWFGKNNDTKFTGDAKKVITEGPIADHASGASDQKVIFIEYGDFQCPGCKNMSLPVKALAEKYKDKVTFVFRNMPLTNIHPNALAAATAVEAAGLQGKYFEMLDLLYENQDNWKGANAEQRGAVFEGYAAALGLDASKFKNDLGSKDIASKIARDRATAKDFGVSQTPSFVLNGALLPSDISTDVTKMEAALKEAIDKAYPPSETP